jgi:hypothetical protein
MAKRGALERGQQRLRADRARLAEERVAVDRLLRKLERERAAFADERQRAVAALRVLCARFGDNDWSDDAPLTEVLLEHLAEPLEAMVATVNRRLRRLQATIEPAAGPVSLPSPPVAHRVITVPSVTRRSGSRGYVARCTCSWRSVMTATEDAASTLGETHQRDMAG